MTPRDLKAARRGLGLTQDQMFKLLHLKDVGTLRRWERGVQSIPGPAAVAIAYMLRYGLLDGLTDGLPEWRSP